MATQQTRRVASTATPKQVREQASQPAPEPMLLTIAQAARRLGVGRTVLYPHVMSGRLPSVVLGRSERKILASALPAFLQSLWDEQREALAAS